MDFSFYCNILVSITSWILAWRIYKNGIRNHFIGFFVFTGLSSFVAAYGHASFFTEEVNLNLLLISRLLSIWSLYYFARATLALFDFYTFKPTKTVNAITPLILVAILFIRNSFFPVMIYGVLTMAILGSLAYSINLKNLPKVSVPMITGIVITIAAALIFGFISELGIFKPADISHILMAIALTFMAVGVKNTTLYELEA
ncbi:hypothetical protein GYB22_06850 [bacterium]|nr:hypothetical protein [bacterium]